MSRGPKVLTARRAPLVIEASQASRAKTAATALTVKTVRLDVMVDLEPVVMTERQERMVRRAAMALMARMDWQLQQALMGRTEFQVSAAPMERKALPVAMASTVKTVRLGETE